MSHLRYAGLPASRQAVVLIDILLADQLVAAAFDGARSAALPDWLIVSGVLYNSAWNHLTGQPSGHGIKDIDLFYFDASDLSWEAEDRVIRAAAPAFTGLPLPVEIRNQARVHLWYPQKHGQPCPTYQNSAHPLSYFASKTHAVGLRCSDDGQPELVAPFGLNDLFAFRMTPNHALDNRQTHLTKAARAKSLWPQIEIVDW